jgi:isoleucyl-tRNA synthetase
MKMQVLVTTCVVMAPFTPFFTEVLYQNLRKVSSNSEESIHFCKFPSTTGEVIVHLNSKHSIVSYFSRLAYDLNVLLE